MRLITVFLVLIITFTSCKKEAGEGGTSSIKGKVQVIQRAISSNPLTGVDTLFAADEDVYILYGNSISPNDRIRTSYDGQFEFINLRRGKYTIFVYSDDTTGTVHPSSNAFNRMVIKREVEINDKKNTVDVGTITVYEDL